MSNAFHWEGKPSIFTVGKEAAAFNGIDTQRGKQAAKQPNMVPIVLGNTPIYGPLKMMKKEKK